MSDDELDAAAQETVRCGEPDAARPTLPPADAEAGADAAARLFGRPPDMAWRYANAEGKPAFFVCRLNKPDGGNDILPLSWFAGDGWGFGHWPDARPLYRLDRIAGQPETPIVVCEGEKAADAAARIFPKSIATTSSGGSQAADKSDWTPLGGRRVLIWPDNDNVGANYIPVPDAGELELLLRTDSESPPTS